MRAYRSRVASTNTKGQVEPYTENEVMASLREAFSRPARDPWAKRKKHPQEEGHCLVTMQPLELGRHNTGDSPLQKENPDQQAIANDPENLYLHVGHTGEPLAGHTGEPLSKSSFSRIPLEVSTDRRLSKRDICVYGVLAFSCRSGVVSEVGKRRIAAQAGCAERLVIESLRNLEGAGHIQKQIRKRGQRGRYTLLSPVFAQKQRSAVEEIPPLQYGRGPVATPRKDPRIATVSKPRSHRAAGTPKLLRSAQ